MKIYLKSFIWLVMLCVVLIAALFLRDFHKNMGLIHGVKSVFEGRYFGVSIGSSPNEALAKLEALGLLNVSSRVSDELRFRCRQNDHEEVDEVFWLEDDSFRRGVICISIKDNRVIEIRANYAGFML